MVKEKILILRKIRSLCDELEREYHVQTIQGQIYLERRSFLINTIKKQVEKLK